MLTLAFLQDVVDLRANRWISKDADKGPKTIQQIREEVRSYSPTITGQKVLVS